MMLRNTSLTLALAAGASALVLGPAAVAAEATADAAAPPSAVQELVVTAQKREEDAQKVPIALTGFTQEKLESLGAESFLDYAKFVPSLSFASLGPGQTDIILRGMPIIQGVPTVGLYIDGLSTASGFTNPDPILFDVRDVQILRGPQGTLYGEGAIGGLVLIRHNAPDPKAPHAAIDVVGSYTDRSNKGNDEVNAMLNLPIVRDQLAIRITGFQRSFAGFIDQVSNGQGLVGSLAAPTPAVPGGAGVLLKKDANTERQTGGRIALAYTPTDTLTITLAALYQDTKVGGDNFTMPATQSQLFPTARPSSVFEDFPTRRTDRYSEFSGELADNLGWANLNGIIGYVDRSLDIRQGYTLSSFNTVPGTNDSKPHNFQTEWRLSSPAGQPIQWLIGARYEHGVNHILQTTDIPGFDFRRAVGQSSDTYAVFGEAAYTFKAIPLTARVGLRYFDESQSLNSQVTDSLMLITAPSPFQSRSVSNDDVSPRFVLEYRFDAERMVYASVSKGFRSGGVNVDLCTPTCPTPNFQPSYAPDYVWTYEVGAKTRFLQDRLQVDGALFYNDWKHLQIDGVPTNPNLGFVTNAGAAHSNGAELEVTAVPLTGLTFNVSGSYTQSILDQAAEGAAPGTRLPNTPDYTFSVSADYVRQIAANGLKGFFHVDWAGRGNAFGTIPNIPQSATNGAFQLVFRNEAPAFATVGLRAGIEMEHWSVTAFVENLTNSQASSFDFNDNAVFGAFGVFLEQKYITRPRTVGLELRAHL